MRFGLLYSLIRKEEKLLLKAAADRGVDVVKIDVGALTYGLRGATRLPPVDVVLDRTLSHSQALYALRFFASYGITTVNTPEVVARCGDKALTSIALQEAGVPTPTTLVAFTPEQALEAIEEIGYPAVLKPVTGSWARLLAKVSDRQQAESIIEHKATLGSYQHSIFYIQEYIEKPGRDLRALVIGDQCVGVIARTSDHWITNTQRGGTPTQIELTPQIKQIAQAAAAAVGGGVLGIDLMERPDGSLTCHEVNHNLEFAKSLEVYGIDVPGLIVDYVIASANRWPGVSGVPTVVPSPHSR